MVEMFQARDLSEEAFSYADSCVLMGYCYLMLGDVEEAIRVFTEAVDDYGLGTAKWWLSHLEH